jgi:hypothetical protein
MKIGYRHTAVGMMALVGAFCALRTSLGQSQGQTQVQSQTSAKSQPQAQYNDSQKQYKTTAEQEAERKQNADKIRET